MASKERENWFQDFKKLNQGASPESTPPPRQRPDGSPERRKHVRFDARDANVTLYREGLLTLVGVGKANKALFPLNLSEGGAEIAVVERFPIGARARLRIEIEKYNDSVELSGEVRRCRQNPKNASEFWVALEFVRLDDGQKRKLVILRDYYTSPHVRARAQTNPGRAQTDPGRAKLT